MSEKEDYIRENPIRAGLIDRQEKWPFMLEVKNLEPNS